MKFRKVYVVVCDNHIFSPHNYMSVEMYSKRDNADRACKRQQDKANEEARMLYKANKPIPQYKVHGFYLVHEKLF
ncbi:hypothetical protein [Mucilaginibacter pedocola]|uniref:Uncharacterized protein n=1 Tax=Mucilaginibacter pedocola TaxID=1792845 RepID=A0A1S9PDY7_9SPHI|nr:hypothetical protein [Mucilaginibacter pedocola]OOQ59117.1 hypothetical protein BC343_29280 [Mucilaginibacter pedocola]